MRKEVKLMKKRHCGMCEELTNNKEWCDSCQTRSDTMDKEIKRRLELKKQNINKL